MRLINVSYRLPVTFSRNEGDIEMHASSGGLVSAVQSLRRDLYQVHWVGVANFSEADYEDGKGLYSGQFQLHPVFLDRETDMGFYNGFSNSVLWPLFHYFSSFVEYNPRHFLSYLDANRVIANEVCKLLQHNDDIVWIHDYQLLPLAGMIRELRPNARIGFFLHIPFPSFELIRLLPRYCREALVKGVLGADMIGFHIYEYAQHFLNTLQVMEGIQHREFKLVYQDRNIHVDAFPISIDFGRFNEAFDQHDIISDRERTRQLYKGKKIIFSVDRLDYTKGIIYRLKGFARFMEEHPEWKDRITFILVAIPSRIDIDKYVERKRMVELMISEINGKYGNTKWTPIVYQYGSLNFRELVGLYTACDIALISPLRDGMNLVAKEFVAARKDLDGVLLLSNMTGASRELSDAILFNPLDEDEISASILMALEMPADERKKRMHKMRHLVKTHDVMLWGNNFINSVARLSKEIRTPSALAGPEKKHIINHYKTASKRLLLLDYDGTLVPFKPKPNQAVPGNKLLNLLTTLTTDPKNECVIISGRDKLTLEQWFKHLPATLVAEHGSFVRRKEWKPCSIGDVDWKGGVRRIMATFADNCTGAFIEEKTRALCWHYRNADPKVGFMKSRELINVLKDYLNGSNAGIMDGNKVIEVKPLQINKGNAVLQAFNMHEFDFFLAIGDDRTDEDLFEVINQFDGVTLKVGTSASVAKFRIETVSDALAFLERLASGNS